MRVQAREIADKLRAMANRDRLLMLCRMSEGEVSVGELVQLTGISQSLVSQHLAMLRDAGAVAVRQERQMRFYSISDPKVAAIFDALCEVCAADDNIGEKAA
ncbi:metalloregulator ArsR/SmtB family transcription factor [Novosphingobium sp. KCTC 2891]|nr:metalloregulator ArsR/SmtB family transcription factor [Novosphingobium sp. KCTC 2891]